MNSKSNSADAVRQQVQKAYAQVAQSTPANLTKLSAGAAVSSDDVCGSGGCCTTAEYQPADLAGAIGYSSQELAQIPTSANMGLSCGNPTAIAALKPGEVVLDLGSGGGFDCFIAGPKVGASGRVIGVDMTPDMLAKARGNITQYRQLSGLDNVEFRLGEIEHLPIADSSVDVIISNCVVNLSPDKAQVWREMFRVLKPGGRVALSDLALLQPLPESIQNDLAALVGCVAGAVLVEETRAMAEAAGFHQIQLKSKPEYVEAMEQWHDPLYQRILSQLPANQRPSDFITSLDVAAEKAR